MSTKPKWHFNKRRPCDRARNPSNDAFFTAESLENLSEALVREGIQNSLDAAQNDASGAKSVRIRIAHVTEPSQRAAQIIYDHFAAVAGHFKNGLGKPDVERLFGSSAGYLVFEDFGTKGLQGDVEEYRLEKATKNAFFSFFRAEGMSAKEEDKIGRWGIGKQVFPTASRLHSIFGVTVREEDPAKVLMGSAVVRIHTHDGEEYHPDAWFGLRDDLEQPVSPVRDTHFIEDFEKAFGLRRGREPGLSIVVPSVDERVSQSELCRGVVRSFFWPILDGQLVVDIEAPSGRVTLDAEKVTADLDILPEEDRPLISLASWASELKPAKHIELERPKNLRPSWVAIGDELLPEAKLIKIREAMEEEGRVAIKIPVLVRPKGDPSKERWSSFRVFIESCSGAGRKPLFLREGIVITDVRASAVSGTRALVVVDDKPLAGLLGDSEGVNHTQWQKDSEKFHGRYVYGAETINFVTRSFQEIMQRVRGTGKKLIPNLLVDLFYLPDETKPEEEKGKDVTKRRKKKRKPRGDSKRRYKVQRFPGKGGFMLVPAEVRLEEDKLPLRLRIKAAYGLRGGAQGSFSSWEPDDFRFGVPPLRVEDKEGIVITKEDGNVLELEIRKPDFSLGVIGFDTKRDLFVDTSEIKSANANRA
jgi:hypothetical protein